MRPCVPTARGFPAEPAITRMSGSSATYTGFVRDITDHKLVEQERAQRIERQALVVALGQNALAGLDPAARFCRD